MANEHLFQPKLAADTLNDPQPDPNASLGGFRSATPIADVVSTLTAVTSDRIVVDSSQIAAPDRVGAWIVFLDTNLNEAREVVAFDDGTGTFELDRALPSTPAVSDRYWLFMPSGLFDAFDASDCRSRLPRHRLVYAHNQTGGQLDDVRVYVEDLVVGPVACRLAMGTDNFPQTTNFNVAALADEHEVPALTQAAGFQKTGLTGSPQDFKRTRSYTHAQLQGSPYAATGVNSACSMRDGEERPIWIQLAFDADAPIPRAGRVVFQVFVGVDGVTTASFVVVVDVDGVLEEIVGRVDRRLRLAGGARVSCHVQDSEPPFERVPGATISIELDPGSPGSLNAPSDTVQREDGVPIRRVYRSPTDPGEVGSTVQFDFEVT